MANTTGSSRHQTMRRKAQAEESRRRRNSRILRVSLSAVGVAVVAILARGRSTPGHRR